MTEKVFDRDTLLDLTVNVIPLVIIGFFIVAFAVVSPWGFDSVISGVQFAILGTTFALLAILTYYAGKAIASAEDETDHEKETAPVEADPGAE